jgi:hypothetical protein
MESGDDLLDFPPVQPDPAAAVTDVHDDTDAGPFVKRNAASRTVHVHDAFQGRRTK